MMSKDTSKSEQKITGSLLAKKFGEPVKFEMYNGGQWVSRRRRVDGHFIAAFEDNVITNIVFANETEQAKIMDIGHKPFSEHWWWQKLLDHVYYCKWKYYDQEEMKQDCEVTDFIIGRIRIAYLREFEGKIDGLQWVDGKDDYECGYNRAIEDVMKKLKDRARNIYVLNSDLEEG